MRATHLRRHLVSALAFAFLTFTATVRVVQAGPIPSPWVAQDIGAPAVSGSSSLRFHTKGLHHLRRRIGRVGHERSVSVRVSANHRRRRHHGASRLPPADGSMVEGGRHDPQFPRRRRRSRIRARVGAKRDRVSMARAGERRKAPMPRAAPGRRRAGCASCVREPLSPPTRSTDGATWKSMGSATIALGATAYVGLAVTSHNASASTTAVFSQTSMATVGHYVAAGAAEGCGHRCPGAGRVRPRSSKAPTQSWAAATISGIRRINSITSIKPSRATSTCRRGSRRFRARTAGRRPA